MAVWKRSGWLLGFAWIAGSLLDARRSVWRPLQLFRGEKQMIETRVMEMHGDEEKLKEFHQ